MAKVTQHDMILDYMREFGSISPYEAFRDLGVTKLSTRIGELIKAGKPIEKHFEHGKNRYGDPVTYMRYELREEPWQYEETQKTG